jgi:prolyl 4-hydroxylase
VQDDIERYDRSFMNKRLLVDYIKFYSGVLSVTQCDGLIRRFESDTQHHDIRRIEDGYSFVQLDVTTAWPDVDAEVERILNECYQKYRAELRLRECWPARFVYEHLRMKRYLPDGRDNFPPHVDVTDEETSTRFVTAIIYLNDPGGGGETVFPELGVKMSPQPGNIILFPPLWTFPHAGLSPHYKPKYILHSYLRYPPTGPQLASKL